YAQAPAKNELVYVGHTGTGFNERELARLMKLLKPLETKDCPFRERSRTNERPHWVRPTLVAAVKFTEWTADGKLRHPVYLGLRDDKNAEDVIREPEVKLQSATRSSRPNPETRRGARASSVHVTSSRTSGKPSARTVGSQRELVAQLADLEQSRKD